ncbi:arrestin_C domain-containing protein [Trichonephila clavipes]|nr:arrestin_C domain-containing protein [Trichonephila clavipes]
MSGLNSPPEIRNHTTTLCSDLVASMYGMTTFDLFPQPRSGVIFGCHMRCTLLPSSVSLFGDSAVERDFSNNRSQIAIPTVGALILTQSRASTFHLGNPHSCTMKPLMGADQRATCCLCCRKGVVSVRSNLERSAYCCGESIRLKADIDNQSDEVLRIKLKLVQSLVYADKPQTLDHLEDNIRRVIADIRPQMLEKVIENWTSRLDYIRASRGSPMPEILFKM